LSKSSAVWVSKISQAREDMPAKENSILIQNEAKLIRKIENLNLTPYDSSLLANSSSTTGPLTELPDYDYPSVSTSDLLGPSSHNQNSFKARSCINRGSRASPYGVVSKNKCECVEGDRVTGVKRTNWAARKRYPSMSANANGKTKIDKVESLDDTLEFLHELLNEGNLLKEAVRRLQLGLSPKIQRNFYDSDDDCRTPPPPPAPAPTSFPHSDLCEVGIN